MTDSADEKPASPEMLRVSHELGTPLLHVTGFPELLRIYANDPDRIKEYADIIQQSGGRMTDLLKVVLDALKEHPEALTAIDRQFALTPPRPGHTGGAHAYRYEGIKGPA